MGSEISSLKTIKQNKYLIKITSTEHVNSDDQQFWNEFLSFAFSNLDAICSDSNFMSEYIIPLMSQWIDNNHSSNNIASMIQVFIQKVNTLKKSSHKDKKNYNITVWHAYNLSFILRNMFKYMIETINEENVIKQCKMSNDNSDGAPVIENFINALMEVLVDLNLDNLSYSLHVEACKTLLVLLSVQMFFNRSSMKSVIYNIVMQEKCSIHAFMLAKMLLNNFIDQIPAPVPPSGSIFFGLVTGLWNTITLGYGNKKTEEDLIKEAILARESLLLLLVLTNHCTKDINPYRDALFQCSDSKSELNYEQNSTCFKIDFSKLYKTLCSTLNDDQTTLLLYMLLHQNGHFKTFVLSRTTDLHEFVVPVLKILYNSSERNSHHIYMSLIILLVLSEDNLFNSIVHQIVLPNITWWERNLTEITLGGLIILVIIRTIHFNLTHNRDRFLHTNLCATLANMSNHFKYLHNNVCQKFIYLFERIAKKYFKLQQQKLNGIGHRNESTTGADNLEKHSSIDELRDITLHEEVLRTILEIINASLTKNLISNPNLIYTLLYNRKVFEPFLGNQMFQDIIANIDILLTYFSNRIDLQEGTLSVDEVFEIIKQASLNWPKEKMKKFPDLMFRYVEDEQPEDFFIPYIWSLVFRCSDICWNSQNILLFNPVRNF